MKNDCFVRRVVTGNIFLETVSCYFAGRISQVCLPVFSVATAISSRILKFSCSREDELLLFISEQSYPQSKKSIGI